VEGTLGRLPSNLPVSVTLLFELGFIFLIGVVLIVAFDKGVLARLRILATLAPSKTRLVLELFLELLQSILLGTLSGDLCLAAFANATPASPGSESARRVNEDLWGALATKANLPG